MKVNYILYIFLILFLASCSTKRSQEVYVGVSQEKPPQLRAFNLKTISRITGEALMNETFPNSNKTASDYDVYGTDLGIMWHMKGTKVGIFFGDTNGKGFKAFSKEGGGNGSNWRSNVLAYSENTDLENGLILTGMEVDEDGKAREVIPGGKANPNVYQTSIPTAAIRVNDVDYVHYMNIYNWSGPKCSWLSNYSSLYASHDEGRTWQRKSEVTFEPLSHFSQVAYAKKDGMIYMIGTQSGRGDAGYLARFSEKNILNKGEYEYWNGNSRKWIKGDEKSATPIISAPVGEISFMYHKKYKLWILTHNYDYRCDNSEPIGKYLIVYRTADDITEWSAPEVLVSDKQFPGLYCAYMHPLKNNEDKLYFLMSLWGQYNTFLMSVDIEKRN